MIPSNTSLLSCYLVSSRLLPSAIFIAFHRKMKDSPYVGCGMIDSSHIFAVCDENDNFLKTPFIVSQIQHILLNVALDLDLSVAE